MKDELVRFALVAQGGGEASPPAIARVLVKDVNRPPQAEVVTPLVAAPGDEVMLDGSGSSDPDGDPLAFKWTQTGGPEVTLSSATADKPSFTAPDVGNGTQLTFSLQVQDATLTSESAVVVVTVDANAGKDTGSGGGAPKSQGCGCAAPGLDGSVVLGLLALVLAARRPRDRG